METLNFLLEMGVDAKTAVLIWVAIIYNKRLAIVENNIGILMARNNDNG
jgi:hypothetical protein